MVLLKRSWLVALVPLLVVLAACGSGDGDKAVPASVDSQQAVKFRKLIGLSEEDAANLRGKTFNLGAVLPLSGPGSVYGVEQGNGVDLAVEAMRGYVGLDVKYTVKDHKSGDPQAGAQTARELGIAGNGAVINSYYGVFGSTLKPVQQYKMLSFDPGGGTGNGLKGQDYFWGFRANTPDDAFYSLPYFKDNGGAQKVALVIWDAGDAYTDPIKEHLEERTAENGMTLSDTILVPIGATDYSSTISKLKDIDADLVALVTYGVDTGYFMKQYVSAGLRGQVVGGEYVPDAAKVAGTAFDEYTFGADYFDPAAPPNPLSKEFVDSYIKKFGSPPATFYAANYYEATLAFLQLAARVAADGGDINSGEDLNKALIANPKFASVYGGNETTVGEIELDAETHDPKIRPVGLFQAGTDFKQLASWNIGGSDFTVEGD